MIFFTLPSIADNKTKKHKNISNSKESLNLLNTNNNFNGKSNYNNDNSNIDCHNTVSNISRENNLANVILTPSINISLPLNNDVTDVNESNTHITLPSSINNCNLVNKSLHSSESIQEVENGLSTCLNFPITENTENIFPMFPNTNSSVEFNKKSETDFNKNGILLENNDCLKLIEDHADASDCIKHSLKESFNQSKQNDLNKSFELNTKLINKNDCDQSNSLTNDSNLTEQNCKKPIKLNIVTTEPYPKYTPTVEKVIKKYENKPKKECIVM